MKNTKDLVTNIVAIVSVIGGAVNAYLQTSGSAELDWMQLGGAVLMGVVAWFTGKSANGAPKTIN